MSLFTLVRHSGFAVGGNPSFENAVELAEITDLQAYTVRQAGGELFPTREAAILAQQTANAPGRVETKGYFSSQRIGGAEIHVPRRA